MILLSREFTQELEKALETSRSSCFIASAFIKKDALVQLSKSFSKELHSVSIVARWRMHDIVAGASDLETYEICRENGWAFGVDNNLHGKIYLIDESEVFLGSANLTQRGLLLHGPGNNEFGTRLPVDSVDLQKVNSFIQSEIVWMTDDLYADLKAEINSLPLANSTLNDIAWSSEIVSRIDKPVEYLWVEDLLCFGPSKLLRPNLDLEGIRHDFAVLGLDIDNVCSASLKGQFRKSKVFKWLVSTLDQEVSISFGGFSKKLHDKLLNKPLPYRKQVKEYVRTIFEWCEFMEEDFAIEQFTRTSSVS